MQPPPRAQKEFVSNTSRRRFLSTAALATVGFSLPARIHSAAQGSNSDIRIGVVGFNGRGKDHIANYLKLPGVRIAALCDVDPEVLNAGVAQLRSKGANPAAYTDLRKLLESGEIDAVSIATPNHWHALGAIWSCQAGKHVYVEKPVSHTVWEGRQIVHAAAQHRRVVQMGIQSRSGAGIAAALRWAAEGHLGKIRSVTGLCYKRRPSIDSAGSIRPHPEGLDYDLWCGPAPKADVRRKKFHYDWHWLWDFGNGDLGNQGVHQMDIARRFLGEPGLPPSVLMLGGRLGYSDDGETPNTALVLHNYAKAPLLFEVRGLPSKPDSKEMDQEFGSSVGVVAHYEKGRIVCPNYSDAAAFDDSGKQILAFGKTALPKDPANSVQLIESETADLQNHYANFLRAVHANAPEILNGPIREGHISSALCHIANISYRLGKPMPVDVAREKLGSIPEAKEAFDRMLFHLEANGLPPASTPLTTGKFLQINPQPEIFLNSEPANTLLHRKDRPGFQVPNLGA
jgi:predicted dehydrogenase